MRSDAKRNETKRRDATLCGAPRRLSHVFGNPPIILASRQPTEFLAAMKSKPAYLFLRLVALDRRCSF